ncbi:relaxase/mobilization nuclease domain-containing protein [Vibrio vulnificus]|uniref:relaxase/mobilization nuclease domain-containing protein n=1 Tax=Vibrio vulnificus TaxID=672 RepID=UPI00102C0AF1|nr:relaxase/mobilization nuclease domain-containing protein [Vibrio vulnificus]RZR40257.1 relaxase [Vibrio vulnificus]RZR40263.1 relaxase [Vibrio vulnificus]
MIVKFFTTEAHGNPLGGLNYLLHKSRNAEPEVLIGNVEVTKQLLLQNEFTRAYTSGVLSFEEKSDEVDFETQMRLCRDFEKTLLPGLKEEQYDCVWIRHTDKKNGRLELNFHVVNRELTTNKRLQVYFDKIDRRRIRTWKELQNDVYQFSDPNAPDKKRLTMWDNNFRDRREVLKSINDYILDAYVNNEIKNQNDVVNLLKEVPKIEISRITKNSISIKHPDFNKAFRLKGELYERTIKEPAKLAAEKERAQKEYEANREERIRENKRSLKQLNSSFAKKRYRHFAKFERIDFDNNDHCDGIERISDEQILEEHLSRVQELHCNERKRTLMSDRLASLRAQIELPEAEEKPEPEHEQEIINRLEKVRYESAANQLVIASSVRRIATAIREAIETLRERTQKLEEIIFLKREQRLADLTGNDKRNELRAEEQHVREVQQSKVLPTNNKSKRPESGLAL